jgi:hypothetical protein
LTKKGPETSLVIGPYIVAPTIIGGEENEEYRNR